MGESIGLEAVMDMGAFNRAQSQYMGAVDKMGGETSKQANIISRAMAGVGGAVGKGMAAFGSIGLAINGVKALASTVMSAAKSFVAENAEFEQYNVRFTTLLKSADAAKDRMKELAIFGAKTPFDLPGVVKADTILQGFGLHSAESAAKFGFAGAEIRTIAGDVASGTGASFEQMALLLGKFASGATGEVIMRFSEMGITTREEMGKLGIEFSKSGQMLSPLPEAMNIVLKLMKDKYGGLMDAQSSTFEGMISNLSDWQGNAKRVIMAPLFEVLKEKLAGLLTVLDSEAVMTGLERLASGMASALKVGLGAIESVVKGVKGLIGAFKEGVATVHSFSGGVSGVLRALDLDPKIVATLYSVSKAVERVVEGFRLAKRDLPLGAGAAVEQILLGLGLSPEIAELMDQRVDKVVDGFNTIIEYVNFTKEAGGNLEMQLRSALAGIFDALGMSGEEDELGPLEEKVFTTINGIQDIVKTAISQLRESLAAFSEGDESVGVTRLLTMLGVPSDIAATLGGWVETAVTAVQGAIQTVKDALFGAGEVDAEGGDAGDVATKFLQMIGVPADIAGVLGGIVDQVATAWADVWARIQKIFNGGGTGGGDVGAGAAASAGGIDWSGLLASVETLGGVLLESLSAVLETAWTGAWAYLSEVEIPFLGGETIGGIVDEIVLKFEDLRTRVEETFTAVGDFINNTLIPILAGVGAGLTAGIIAYVAAIWSSLIPALAAWATTIGTTVIPMLLGQAGATAAAMAPLLPFIALALAVGAAVALLVAAWKNDWGGIRTFMTDLWDNKLKPIFDTIVEWFKVMIPAAIDTVAGFWTDTLLPAIQSVWAWIDTNLLPLFRSIENLLSAVVGVALTACAGLWENVLLPAIQKVGDFFTGTIVPALESVSDTINKTVGEAVQWLADLWNDTLLPAIQAASAWFDDNITPALEKAGKVIDDTLGPAIEWVTGLFDKADGGLRGISSTIEKVTGFFDKLTQKVKDFKLPDVLTPGSPTPMETGMRGIGDALLEVSEYFMMFAQSVTPAQAKTMKDVASAFKDMGKGVDELVGSFAKLYEMGEGGMLAGNTFPTLEQITASLDQFLAIADVLMERIQGVIDAIGYDKIHKLRLTARRLSELISVLLIDLSPLTKKYVINFAIFDQLHQAFLHAAGLINQVRAKFSDKMLTDMTAVASNIKGVVAVIEIDVSKVVPSKNPRWMADLELLITQIQALVDAVVGWLGDMTQSARNAIAQGAKNAALIKELYTVLISPADVIKPYASKTWQAELALTVEQIAALVTELAAWLGAITGDALDVLTNAAAAADAMKGVLDIIKPGVDALTAVGAYVSAALLPEALEQFENDLVMAMRVLARIATQMNYEAITAAVDIFEAAQKVLGIIKPAVDALTALGTYASVQNLGGVMVTLAYQIETIINYLVRMSKRLNSEAVTAAAEMVGSISTILNLIKPAVDALAALVDYPAVSNIDGVAFTLATQISILVTMFMRVAKDLSNEGLAAASETYTAMKGIIDFVKPAIDMLAALAAYEETTDLMNQADRLANGLMAVIPSLQHAFDRYNAEGIPAAAELYGAMKGIVDFVKPAIDMLTALAAYEETTDLMNQADRLANGLMAVIPSLQHAFDHYDSEGTAAASGFYNAAKGIIDFIKPGIDAIGALATFAEVADLPKRMVAFAYNLKTVIDGLKDIGTGYDIEGLAAARLFGDAAKDIVGMVGPGISALEALLKYESGDVVAALALFKADFRTLVTGLAAIAYDLLGTEGLDVAIAFKDVADAIAQTCKSGVEAIATLGAATTATGTNTILQAFAEGVKTWLAAAVTNVKAELAAFKAAFASDLPVMVQTTYNYGYAAGQAMLQGWRAATQGGFVIPSLPSNGGGYFPVSPSSTSSSVTVNFGGVNISNGMDQTAFENRVLQVVSAAVGR